MTPDETALTSKGDGTVANGESKAASAVPPWIVKAIALFWLGVNA